MSYLLGYFDQAFAHPLAQAVGIVGMVLGIVWPLFRARRALLVVQALCFFLFVVHFHLLGAETGVWLNVLGGLQALAAIPLGTRPGFRYVYLATLPMAAACVVLTWGGPPSLFAGLGVALTTWSRYQLDVSKLRLGANLGLCCWLVHNVLVLSVPGTITDLGGIIANTAMIRRERRRRIPPRR